MIYEEDIPDFVANLFDAAHEELSEGVLNVTELFFRLVIMYPDEYEDLSLYDFKDALLNIVEPLDPNEEYNGVYYLYFDGDGLLFDLTDWTVWFSDDDDIEKIKKSKDEKTLESLLNNISELVNEAQKLLKHGRNN